MCWRIAVENFYARDFTSFSRVVRYRRFSSPYENTRPKCAAIANVIEAPGYTAGAYERITAGGGERVAPKPSRVVILRAFAKARWIYTLGIIRSRRNNVGRLRRRGPRAETTSGVRSVGSKVFSASLLCKLRNAETRARGLRFGTRLFLLRLSLFLKVRISPGDALSTRACIVNKFQLSFELIINESPCYTC